MGLTWRSVCSFTLASMPSCVILKDAIDTQEWHIVCTVLL